MVPGRLTSRQASDIDLDRVDDLGEQLGVFVGLWHGVAKDEEHDWIRLFRPDGSLVPTREEAERQKADAESSSANEPFGI